MSIYVAERARLRGMGRELGGALIERLRVGGYRSVTGVVAMPNPASEGLLRALGFRPVGILREAGYKLERWWDVQLWQRSLQQPHGDADGSGRCDGLENPRFRTNSPSPAPRAIASAMGSTVDQTGSSRSNTRHAVRSVAPNSVRTENQSARLRITPTTAAVMAESAGVQRLAPAQVLDVGRPRKMNRKHGTYVTQVVTRGPSAPATIGRRFPGSRYAPGSRRTEPPG